MRNVRIGDFESAGVEAYGPTDSRVYKFTKVKAGCVMLTLQGSRRDEIYNAASVCE